MTHLEYEVELNDIKNELEIAKKNDEWFKVMLLRNRYNYLKKIADLDMAIQRTQTAYEEYCKKVKES